MSNQWTKLDIDAKKIPALRGEQAEAVVLACQRLRVEAEGSIKAAEAIQEALLASLRQGNCFPEDFNIPEYVNSVCGTVMARSRELNDGLAKLRQLNSQSGPVQ